MIKTIEAWRWKFFTLEFEKQTKAEGTTEQSRYPIAISHARNLNTSREEAWHATLGSTIGHANSQL